jgi:hypothetical protein
VGGFAFVTATKAASATSMAAASSENRFFIAPPFVVRRG